jgi:hypothetical protein
VIGEVIRVAGRFTLEDFDRLFGGGAFARWQARITYAACVVIWLGFVVVNVVASPIPWREQLTTIGMNHYTLLAGSLFIGLFVWFQYSVRRNLRKQHENEEGMFAPQQMVISDEGIAVTTPLIQSQVQWDAFAGTLLRPDYLVLYLKPDRVTAVHLARSWFADETQWRRLVDFVLHRLPEVK